MFRFLQSTQQKVRQLPDNQSWLLDGMDKLKNKADNSVSFGRNEGVCFGVGAMSTISFHSEKNEQGLERYNIRMLNMHKLFKSGKHSHATTDMLAFLNGVELAQQPDKHSDIFPEANQLSQNIETITPLILSQAVEVRGGLYTACKFTGIYRQKEIEQLLVAFETSMATQDTKHKVSLFIHANHHAICLHYSAGKKPWHLVNAGAAIQYDSSEKLAAAVFNALNGQSYVAFATHMITTADTQPFADDVATEWKNSSTWRFLHRDPKKIAGNALRKAHDKTTWLMLAAKHNDLSSLTRLIKHRADVNATTTNNVSALHLAAEHNHYHAIKLLHKANANLNIQRKNDGMTALYFASAKNHFCSAEVLLKAGADINLCCTNNNSSPLHSASFNNHIRLVNLLLDHDADVNCKRSDNNVTPLGFAAFNGLQAIVEVLLERGADPSIARQYAGDVQLPEEIATDQGFAEVAKICREARLKQQAITSTSCTSSIPK